MEMIKKKVDAILLSLTGTILVVMSVLILWQIFSRYVLQQPFATGEESVRLLLIWLSLCGGAYGFGSGSHIALDMIFTKVHGKNRIILEIILQVICLLFIVSVLIIGGITMVLTTTKQVTPALQLPVSYLYLSLPVGGLFALYYTIYNIIQYIKNLKEGR